MPANKSNIDVQFQAFSKKVIANKLNCQPEQVYTVWMAKTLQHIKGLFSSDVIEANGLYYEATYNGDKKELYLDTYSKILNEPIKIDLEN